MRFLSAICAYNFSMYKKRTPKTGNNEFANIQINSQDQTQNELYFV